MAELVDAEVLKTSARKGVPVRVRLRGPIWKTCHTLYLLLECDMFSDEQTLWLRNKLARGHDFKDLVQELGYSKATCYKWLSDFDFRDSSGLVLSKESEDFIEATLLGDGSIPQDKTGNVFYTMSGKNTEYIQWVKSHLIAADLKLVNMGDWTWGKEISGLKTLTSRSYARSRVAPILRYLRERWYPHGKKQVPLGFKWSFEALAIFIAEDGTRARHGSVIYWGEKSPEAFDHFIDFLEASDIEFTAQKPHATGGQCLYLRDTKSLTAPPGYSHKFN